MTQSNHRLPTITNYTLEQLNAMSREDFIKHFPQTHSRWIKKGYLVNAKNLMRAVIYATAKIDWPVNDTRGPREVWYNPVKPIMMRAIGDRANKYDGYFEKLLSKIVKNGKIRYEDLGIKDFRTLRENYEDEDRATCWKNILLFVEKDSAYVHLRPLKKFLNINIMSGAGWSNTSGIEGQLTEMRERGVTEIEIFTVVDYDAFGFAINQEFADKCKMMGFKVIYHKRMGVGIEHTNPELLEFQKYPVKPGKKLTVNGVSFDSDKWLAEYGIEGKYGIEIEAISGQPGGHQKLREIVLQELLAHLKEYDRIWEITEPLWVDMPRKVVRHYLDAETYGYWMEHPNVEYLTYYYTPDDYEKVSENLSNLKEEDTAILNEALGNAEEELYAAKRNLDVNLANKYAEYQVEIDRLWKEHINPIEEKRDVESETIRERDSKDVDSWQNECESISSQIYDIEEPYDGSLSHVKDDYEKSRSLYAQAHFQWLKDNIQRYIDLAPETEDLSFGLMKDCLMEALKAGKTIRDLIRKADTWDENQAYNYIENEIERDTDIQKEISKILQKLIEKIVEVEDVEADL